MVSIRNCSTNFIQKLLYEFGLEIYQGFFQQFSRDSFGYISFKFSSGFSPRILLMLPFETPPYRNLEIVLRIHSKLFLPYSRCSFRFFSEINVDSSFFSKNLSKISYRYFLFQEVHQRCVQECLQR